MVGFDEYAYATQFRDLIKKVVAETLESERPKYKYATVTDIDRPLRKATIIFNGETSPVIVNMGSIQPRKVGQIVRVEGIGTDKFISDVVGPAYGGGVDYNILDNSKFEKRTKYPLSSGFGYSTTAAYLRSSNYFAYIQCENQAPGEWRASGTICYATVEPDERYNWSFYVMRVNNASTPSNVYFNFVNAAGAIISSEVHAIGATLGNGVWVRRSGAFRAPAGAVGVRVYIVHASVTAGTTGTWWFFDNFHLSQFGEDLWSNAGSELKTWADDRTSTYGHTRAPRGYLECDGSAVSRSLYPELFANIGTRYGAGDGSTTFNVPDYRGTFLVNGSGSSAFITMGQTGGALTHSHPLSAAGQALITMSAVNSPNMFMKRVTAASYNSNVQGGFSAAPAASSASWVTGAELGGNTDAASTLPPYTVVRTAIRASV